MKQKLLILYIFLIQGMLSAQTEIADCCRGCTGSSNCTACKNCSGCEHCKKRGGTCGACTGSGGTRIKTPPITSQKWGETSPIPKIEKPQKTTTIVNNDIVEAPFTGKVRKMAKTSVANGKTYSFDDVSEFLQWLPTDSYMKKLGINDNSPRTRDENYNIEIKKTSIIRIQLEKDNDIHITICDWEDEYTPINILTVEVSGLPNELSASYRSLLAARQQFYDEFSFFKTKKSASYKTKSKSPKVTLTGSLFFDYYHNRDNEDDEYNKLKHKSNTSFEIHPITWIERVD